jgi:putative endonuclease
VNLFKSKATHLSIGQKGERFAVKEMKRMGLTVLRTNYSVHGIGEIDIIGRDGTCLVFVEVKTRSSDAFGRPGEAVNKDKKKKLWKTAHMYMRQLGNTDLRFRFDVVEVYLFSRFRKKVIYLPGAFDMDDIQTWKKKY